jgi:hypothetical protein
MKTVKSFLAGLLLFFVLSTSIFAEAATVAQLLWASRFGMRFNRYSTVQLDSRVLAEAAADGSGGVLFQAVALPEDDLLLGKPLTLVYNPGEEDGRRLSLTFAGTAITVEGFYDWMLLPTANFANTAYYTCVTLFDDQIEGHSLTEEEKIEKETVENRDGLIYWAGYHPALIDTLVGLNCFFVDAMLINPIPMYRVTRAMPWVKGYNAESNSSWTDLLAELEDEDSIAVERLQHIAGDMNANTLARMLNSMQFLGLWNSYIYGDCGEKILFRIENNRVDFTGGPHYQFVKEIPFTSKEAEYFDAKTVTNVFKENPEIIWELNQDIYDTAEKTARWAALFRYARRTNPSGWAAFMGQIGEKIIPQIDENGEVKYYKYNIDEGRDTLTPGSFVTAIDLIDLIDIMEELETLKE